MNTETSPNNLRIYSSNILLSPLLRKGLALNSPVRPLLVQHTVPALFAADGIAALQGDFVVAVAAQVVHRALRVFEAAAAGLEACV